MTKKQNNNGHNKALARRKEYLKGLLNADAFEKAVNVILPKHLTAKRVVEIALVAASRNPKLFECTPQSLLQSVMKSAETGLDCTGTMGQAYLVPYYNSKIKAYECQFIAGYQGLIELAYRSQKVKFIDAQIVHQNDHFEYELGSNPYIKHIPFLGDDKGDAVCVYAVAELSGSGKPKVEILTMKDVNGVKDRSKARDNGPWITDYDEMARKTAVRKISKYILKSPELMKALEADDAQFEFNQQARKDIKAGVAGVKERLQQQKEEKEIDAEFEEEVDPATRKKALEQKAALKDAESKKKEPKTPQENDGLDWRCNRCGKGFFDPDENDLCPHCFSNDIVNLTEYGAETQKA